MNNLDNFVVAPIYSLNGDALAEKAIFYKSGGTVGFPGVDMPPLYVTGNTISLYYRKNEAGSYLSAAYGIKATIIPDFGKQTPESGLASTSFTTLQNNTGAGNGAGIALNQNAVGFHISGVSFTGNKAKCEQCDAGGLYLGSNNQAGIVQYATFVRNTAGRDGGGMYVGSFASGVKIIGSTFTSNTATTNG